MDSGRRNIWLTVCAAFLLIGLSLSMFIHKITSPRLMTHQELQLHGAYVLDKPRIIKPISLLNQDGESFTLDDLKGQWSLLFFGYTYCPDICPTTLAELKVFKSQLVGTGLTGDTQVILVSGDPARDTPAKLKDYLAYFDPEFIGVTGDFLALHAFAANVNATFNKVVTEDRDNYLIDHTSNIVLVNPYGHYHGFFKPQATLTSGQFDPGKLKATYRSIRLEFDRNQ